MKKWAIWGSVAILGMICFMFLLGTCSPATSAVDNLPTTGLPDWQVAMVSAAPYALWIFMGVAGLATVSYIISHWKS